MNTNQESVLFRASSGTDVQSSGGILNVAGLPTGTQKSRITSFQQLKYHAEVVQVVKIGGTAYIPTGGTQYTIEIGDVTRRRNGAQEPLTRYTFTTPTDITTLGATAALQSEAIHAGLVLLINAKSPSNFVTAASAGGGAGINITDLPGYYPVFNQTTRMRNGQSTVLPCQNPDDTGFLATNVSITTQAVYSFGVGADLVASIPVIDALYGGLLSGYLYGLMNGIAPKTAAGLPAVSGQNYDAFIINSLTNAQAHNQRGQLALVPKMQAVFVDNGTGSSTANLAGFQSFERAMLHHLFDTYKADQSTIVFMGDTGPTCGGLNTGLPSGVTLAENFIQFGNGFSTHYYPLGTATLVALTSTNSGIGCVLDATAGEGVELSAPTWTNSLKSAVVGKTAFSIYCKITIDDVSGLNPMWVGFRLQEAANATYTAYNSYALVGLGNATGDIFTSIELAGGGNTNTDTTQNWADTETHTLEVRVDINGAVTFFIDGYKPTVTQAFSFTAGQIILPVFCYALQASDIGTPSVLEGAFLPTDNWRS